MKKTVDVVIPSYKPDHKFDRLMHMLQKQTYPIGTILIVNTEEKFFPEKMDMKRGRMYRSGI